MRELSTPGRVVKVLSRGALEELGALQASVHELGAQRTGALSRFLTSRHVTTVVAQREFWLEFSWVDQQYRAAVRRVVEFCRAHRCY
jgi:hypothetical protein